MEIKNFINSEAPKGEEVFFTHTWLSEYLTNLGYNRITFKPREMPVYVRDDNNEYVKDKKGDKKLGYKTIKVEFTYCDPESDEFVNVFESTNRVDTTTGETVDVSPWAYNVLSKFERQQIMKYGVRNIMLRTGIYHTKDENGKPIEKRRQTWDAVILGNGETLTPVGGKRGYHQWDANPDDPTATIEKSEETAE